MKTAPVKTGRDGSFRMVEFRMVAHNRSPACIISLQSAKKLFQKGNLENKCVTLTLSGADVRARSVSIDPYTYWGLYRFFQDISLDNET